jgi:hypothetical protein
MNLYRRIPDTARCVRSAVTVAEPDDAPLLGNELI